jgi:cation-transporting ATPase E
VLLLGRCTGTPDPKSLNGAVEPIALAVLANPIRPEAKENFEFFAEQGIK